MLHNITDVSSKLQTPSNVPAACHAPRGNAGITGITILFACVHMHNLDSIKESQWSGEIFNDMFGNRLQQVQHTMQPSWFSIGTLRSTHVGKVPFKSCSNRKVELP